MPPFAAVGVANDAGLLIGGWLITGFNGFNADLTIYGPGALTKRTIAACLAHLFIDHGVIRVTAHTRRDNLLMREILRRFGFQFEGLRRRYYGPLRRDDAFMFAFFKSDAERWLARNTGTSTREST